MAVLQERNNEQQTHRHTPVKQIPAALQLANQKRRDAIAQQQQKPSGKHPRLSQLNNNNNGEQQRQVSSQVVLSSDRYEEWMKIATDGKITATNTWNLALIDYFHDMSLLRSDDNSINFQKASCTLDGCVKIWTSRVDSVANETGKLLSGLAQDPRRAQADDDDDDQDGDDDNEGGTGNGGEGTSKAKRARKAQTSTLADSFEKLKAKSLDLEFTVDPLFKKTSADFDEGGASGILMNHLGCDGQMRVVFDAGDAKLSQTDEDAEGDDDASKTAEAAAQDEEEQEHVKIDLSALKAKFLPSLDELSERLLCPTLASFKFGNAQSLDLGTFDLSDDVPVLARQERSRSDGNDGGDDFGDAARNDDYIEYDDYGGGGEDEGPQDHAIDSSEPVDFFANEPLGNDSGLSRKTFRVDEDDVHSQQHLGEEVVMSMEDLKHDLFDQFDGKQKGRNWAGPEHWKMRRNLVKAAGSSKAGVAKSAGQDDDNDDDDAGPSRSRKDKAAFKLDFDAPPPVALDELFAPMASRAKAASKKSASSSSRKSTRASSVAASESIRDSKQDFTLPRDYHFNASRLLRLFLKPDMPLKLRRRVRDGPAGGSGPEFVVAPAPRHAPTATDAEEELMNAFLEATSGAAADLGGMDYYDDGEPAHFATQFLAADDDDDDAEAEYFGEGVGGSLSAGNQPLADGDPSSSSATGVGADQQDDDAAVQAAASQAVRRVRPEHVNYAKKAKRVDVKKLKENIWTTLERNAIVVPELPAETVYVRDDDDGDDDQGEHDAEQEDEQDETIKKEQSLKLKQRRKKEAMVPVIESLKATYPKERMDEISTSFCFICLLHLANEKGLRIQVPVDSTKEAKDDADSVARFEQLRVLKAANPPSQLSAH